MLGCKGDFAFSVESSDPSYTQPISSVPTQLTVHANMGTYGYYRSDAGAFEVVSSTCTTAPEVTQFSTQPRSRTGLTATNAFEITLDPGNCTTGQNFVLRVDLSKLCILIVNTFSWQCGDAGTTDLTFTLGSIGTIFLTSATHNGNFGGVAGADAFCQADASKPDDGLTYKALLANTTDRIACVSADCATDGVDENVGWVLQPETTYYRPDDTLIGTTDESGIFAFPLTAAISATNALAWTGLNEDWTTETNHCVQWNSATAFVDYGAQGKTDETSTDALYLDGTPVTGCTNSRRLYCVSQ